MSSSNNFYYKNNKFQQLRGFYYAATLGSITKAAERISLTQSSVSLQIKALEEDFGCKLFTRSGPTISPSKEGTLLLSMVEPMINNIENLKHNFEMKLKAGKHQTLNIAANQATMLYLLPKLVHNFSQKCPDISINIHGAVALEGIDKLLSGEVDIIVGPSNFDIPDTCEYIPVFHYDPVLITRSDHPLAGKERITIEQMCQYHLILPPSHLHTIIDLGAIYANEHYKPDQNKLKFNGWEIIKKYVELDMAITIALSIAIEEDPVLIGTKLNHLFSSGSYGYIVVKGKEYSQPLRAFIDSINN